MSGPAHPLCDVFSECDLGRLSKGRCVDSDRMADKDLARLLTERYDRPDNYCVSVGEWFRQMVLHGDDAIRDDYRARLRDAVSGLSAFHAVSGELMAAYFLARQLGFDLDYIPRSQTARTRTPEFKIRRCGLTVMAEVKTPVDRNPLTGARGFKSRAAAVRKAMDAARGQLDDKSSNNLLLIVDWYSGPGIPWEHAVDALYGDAKICQLVGPDGPVGDAYQIREENVHCQPEKNTRFGAVGILRWQGRAECEGYFVHNLYAPNRIPNWAFDPWPQFVMDEAKRSMVWRNRSQTS